MQLLITDQRKVVFRNLRMVFFGLVVRSFNAGWCLCFFNHWDDVLGPV